MHKFIDRIHHLFIPRHSNNHRAKLLHHSSLSILIALVLLGQVLINLTEEKFSSVLGISHSISIDDLVNQTNQKRQEAGLPFLNYNGELSQAAAQKAQHMIANNYWAHNAPDGTTPWFFIKSSGYEYVFAGENLARGFTNTSDAVNAWMASPGHRENIMSSNYKDIGFAILTGTLDGEETVLIVQMFGSRDSANVAQAQSVPVSTPTSTPVPTARPIVTRVPLVVSPTRVILPTATPTLEPTDAPTATPTPSQVPRVDDTGVAAIQSRPLVNSRSLTRDIAIGVVGLLIVVLLVDLVVVERKRIVRVVSHNLDHIIFLAIILIAILIFTSGKIL